MIEIPNTNIRLDAYFVWTIFYQCRFVVLAIQEAFQGEDFLQDVLVEFVVTVYPRIVSTSTTVVVVWGLQHLILVWGANSTFLRICNTVYCILDSRWQLLATTLAV